MGKLRSPTQLHVAAIFLGATAAQCLQGRRQVKGFEFRRWPSAKLYKEFGLYAIPQHARIGPLACLEVKMIGMPYAGELHARLDEGEQVYVARRILNGHDAGNGGDKPRIDLTNTEPVLYCAHRERSA